MSFFLLHKPRARCGFNSGAEPFEMFLSEPNLIPEKRQFSSAFDEPSHVFFSLIIKWSTQTVFVIKKVINPGSILSVALDAK